MFNTGTIAKIVRKDHRTSAIFKKWGVNYCCGGNKSLEETCTIQGIDQLAIEKELVAATKIIQIPNAIDFNEWSLDFLTDYILNVHHAYVHKIVPQLVEAINSFMPGHKKKYPYLEKVQEAFEDLANELNEHMEKEEQVIFPYIKQVYNTWKNKEVYGQLFVQLLKKPLNDTAVVEHQRIASLLQQLRKETNNYIFTNDACTRLQVIYRQLHELDNDLVQHKHLENNILFPKSAQMEKALLAL